MSAALAFTFSTLLGYRVFTNFDGVRPEAADNVGWSLSQVEVDASDFNTAIKDVLLHPDTELNNLRLRFDILYSRLNTLRLSPQYRRVYAIPEYAQTLEQAWTIMQSAVSVIDGTDQELRAALPALESQAAELRNHTRRLSVSGLTFFALAGDANRAAVTTMLLQLAGLAILLVAILAA
ncbi:MAG: hypothetical protein GY892_09120, partial [Shimia sp.]|nr:hypothetical protein [Shimia sp.]